MAKYPIKMLKDEEGTPFVPLVSTEALRTPEGVTIEEKLEKKLEPSNLIAGTDITLSVDGNNITINNASKGVLIDNLTTEQSGVGSLDAHQGKILKDMIPDVVNNLTTTSTDKALSAYQGYLLNHKVVPTGGTTGQVLKKSSNDDHALEWGDAADPNAIVGDGSIKKIVELTYEEYQALDTIDPDTEYHIIDAQSAIDNLQAILDSLQEQINNVRTKINTIASKSSAGYVVTSGDGVTEVGKYVDFHSDFTTGNDYDTRLQVDSHNKNVVKLPSASGTLATLDDMIIKGCTITKTVTEGQIIFTITGIPIDCGLMSFSFHLVGNNFGGSILLNVAYFASVVNTSFHNQSGTSVTMGGNVAQGITLTLKDSNITSTSDVEYKAYRFRNYRGA